MNRFECFLCISFVQLVKRKYFEMFSYYFLRDRLQLSMFKKEEQRSSLWVGGSE